MVNFITTPADPTSPQGFVVRVTCGCDKTSCHHLIFLVDILNYFLINNRGKDIFSIAEKSTMVGLGNGWHEDRMRMPHPSFRKLGGRTRFGEDEQTLSSFFFFVGEIRAGKSEPVCPWQFGQPNSITSQEVLFRVPRERNNREKVESTPPTITP